MNILIIGSGGREHVLATAYSKSKKVKTVYVAPGNDFMSFQNSKIRTLLDIQTLDFEKITKFAKKEKIDLVDVAQDEPLAKGLVDYLSKHKIKTFGPTQNASEIEWDKEWARQFMETYKLPIPHFQSFNNEQKATTYIESFYSRHQRDSGQSQNDNPILFIKASGLALGKGVIKVENPKDAIIAISQMKIFGKAGETFLIEQALIGEEFSLFALCNGKDYSIIAAAQDHKTVFEADQGSNTGGMGCVTPTTLLSPSIIRIIELTILKPFMKGMEKEGRPYTGILYLGGMITHSASSGQAGVKIIEFNARWGDPEAEVILPSLKVDYVDIVEKVVKGESDRFRLGETIRHDDKVRISIAGCARGYPDDYKKVIGKPVHGIEKAMKLPGITIFGAGIKKRGTQFVVNGGRIFHLVAEGKDIQDARRRAYEAMSLIYVEGNNLHYRTDIGWREVERIQ